MEIEFCNNDILKNQIIELIQKEITPNFSEGQISEYYNIWKEKFETVNTDFRVSAEVVANDFYLPERKALLGIDYPTWFNINLLNTKKVMILGIDPLRSEAAFRDEKADINSHVIIGTPYALHRKNMRINKSRNPKSYWNFVKLLLDSNYGVYLTDIFKVYFLNENGRSYNQKDFIQNDQKHLTKILNKEIEIIKPDLIIAFGGKPLELLIKKQIKITDKIVENLQYDGIPILPMVHLSGLASGGRKKFISNNIILDHSDNSIISYLEIINTFMKNCKLI